MRTYIRETKSLGNGKRMITRYTLEEYLWLSIVKFIIFLCFIWPIEICVRICIWFFKICFGIIKFILSIPLKIIKR